MNKDNLEVFLQDAISIGAGTDSCVYKSNLGNYVIKIYSNLRLTPGKYVDVETCLKMVQRYNSDTLKAKEVIDSQWKRLASMNGLININLGDKNYGVIVSILPQGETRIICDEVVSVGQEYVSGLNLKQIFEHSKKVPGFEDFYDAPNEHSKKIRQMISYANKLIDNIVEVPIGAFFKVQFEIDNKNIKPVIDESKQTLNLIVTDLSTSIIMDYASLGDKQ
jgi:hypothetical protein